MSKTAVLAYSGGLDTSCAIAWLKEDYGYDEVIAVLVDVGQQADFEPAFERGYAAGATEVMLVDKRDEFADEQVAKAIQTNALYEGKYPLDLGAVASGDRRGGRERRARRRRRGDGARLHGQGQRPAALRARVQGAVPRRARDRAAARPDLVARRGDRVRGSARHPGRGEAGVAVLDRRQPLRARDRGGHPRGPVGRAAGGRVRADVVAGRTRPRRSRSSSASSRAYPCRSTARSSRSPS